MGAANTRLSKLNDIGAENMMNTTQSKLKEMGAENMMKYLLEKLKELSPVLQNFGGQFIECSVDVFPLGAIIERISLWIQVSAPFIILVLVLCVLIRFRSFIFRSCCNICRGMGKAAVKMMKFSGFLFRIGCLWLRGTGKAVKMMKAPGRNIWMPRSPFEADPAAYFRGLRAMNR